MAEIEQAKQQVAQARQQLEQRRQQAETRKKQLEAAKKRLPSQKSQRALRQQMGGVAGRVQRQQIRKAEKSIEEQKAGITKIEKQLAEYETKTLKPVESAIKTAEVQKAAIKQAEGLIDRGRAAEYLAFVKPGDYEGAEAKKVREVRKILESYFKQKTLAKQEGIKIEQVAKKVEVAGTTGLTDIEKKRFDIGLKTGQIKLEGKINGELGEIKSIKDYNKYIQSLEKTKVEEVKAVTLPDITEQAKLKEKKTFKEKFIGLFTLPSVSANTKDLKSVTPSITYDTDVSTRDGMGFLGSLRTRITGAVTGIIGDKKDFEKGQEVFVEKGLPTIAAARPEDILKGEQFRPQGELRIERFGTVTEEMPRIETIPVSELRERAVVLGAESPLLFQQEFPKPITKKIEPFIPVLGQIRPVVEAGRELSEQQRRLVGAEAILGAGEVPQKEVRKAIGRLGFESALLGLDIAGTVPVAKAGVRYFSPQARAIRQLAKTQPELFLGLAKQVDGKDALLVGARRRTGDVATETLTKFDVLKIGDKTFQVQKGTGAQVIRRGEDILETRKFTFFGEAQEVPVKAIKRGVEDSQAFELFKGLTDQTGVVSDIRLLTKGDDIEAIRKFGLGIQEKTDDVTKALSFDIDKAFKPKVKEYKVLDIQTGVEETRKVFGKPKAVARDVKGIGLVKDITKETPEVFKYFEGRISPVTQTFEQVGTGVGLQAERGALEIAKPTISPQAALALTPTKDEVIKVTTVKEDLVSVPIQQVIFDVKETKPVQITQPSITVGRQEFRGAQLFELAQEKARAKKAKPKEITTQLGIKATEQVTGFDLAQGQISSQLLKQATAKKAKQVGIERAMRTGVKTTVSPPIIKFKARETAPAKALLGALAGNNYDVIVKRKGKFKDVGDATTPTEAFRELKKKLKGSISASGYIVDKRTGKKISASQFVNGGFRVSKQKDKPYLLVQKKEKRLAKRPETREIQLFRKRSKQKSGWF